MKYLHDYLLSGGFPEMPHIPEAEQRDTLQSYADTVVMRDIIERHHISNIALIKYLLKSLLKNVGSGFSLKKFHNDAHSQGMDTTRHTLLDYLGHLEDAYLVFALPLYSESIRKTNTNQKKIYAIDTGLCKAYSFGISNNLGHLFENLFYLHLRRTGHQVFYYLTEERYEVDFLAIDPRGNVKLYQVAWNVSDTETLKREQRALDIAKAELEVEGELITPIDFIRKIFPSLLT